MAQKKTIFAESSSHWTADKARGIPLVHAMVLGVVKRITVAPDEMVENSKETIDMCLAKAQAYIVTFKMARFGIR